MVKNVFFDMDGVVADFDKDVKKLSHIDERPWLVVDKFFENLEVIGNPNEVMEVLQNLGYNVFILSKVEMRDPMGQARKECKLAWLKKNIPCLKPENIIIVPNHLKKSDFIKVDIRESALVDDYKENLIDWYEQGGYPIKFGRIWKDSRPYAQVTDLFQVIEIVESLK